MENKDVKLIRKYLNLVESFNNKKTLIETENSSEDVGEEQLDEQIQMFQDALKALSRTLEVEKGLWSTIKTEIPQIGNTYKSAAEFKAAVEAGKIGAADSASLVKFAIKNSPELGLKIKGLLQKQPEFAEMAKLIFPKGTQMPADAAKMAIAQKTLSQMGIGSKEAEAMLKNAYQESLGAGKTAVSKFKGVKGGDPAMAAKAKQLKGSSPEVQALVKDADTAQNAANEIKQEIVTLKEVDPVIKSSWQRAGERIGKYSAEKWDKLKQLKGKMNFKKLVLYGLAGYGTYEILKSLFSDGKTEVLQGCVMNLEGSQLSVTSGGDPVVLYKKDDLDSTSAGHGGLKFYDTGRVWTMDNKMKGSYTCSSAGKLTAQVAEGQISEASSIKITWDPQTQDDGNKDDEKPTPSPNPGSKYRDCSSIDINKQSIQFGCKHPIVKKMQECLGLPKKYQTGNFGPMTQKKLGGKSVITKEDYEKVCGSNPNLSGNVTTSDVTNVPGGYKPKGLGKVDPSKYSNAFTGTAPDPSNPTNITSETPREFYDRLKREGLIFGDEAKTYFADGTSYGPSRRIVYKGPDLSKNQLDDLNSVITGLGYDDRFRQALDKRYGHKYVWVR